MEMEEKSEIREQALRARDRLTVEERRQKSLQIRNRLSHLAEFQQAKTVLLYHSFRSEVETKDLIELALKEGKTVALPLTLPGQGLLACRISDPAQDLKTGSFGIREPIREKTAVLSPEEIELVILPGVAFDLKGNRLGWGAGYYDRFLGSLPNKIPLVALAFEVQVVKNIPAGSRDVLVDKIVTEERVIDCKSVF